MVSRKCMREVPCETQQCDHIGTVGNWLPEAAVGSGNAIVQSPVLPNMPDETAIDLVYSHKSGDQHGFMITRKGINGNYSLWRFQVNPVSRLFTEAELLFRTSSVLSAVRIIGSSPLHGEFILLVDTGSCVLRKIELNAPFAASIFAGSESGQCGFANGIGADAQFNSPTDLQVIGASESSIAVVADKDNNCIRRINLNTRQVTTYSGVCAEIDFSSTDLSFEGHWLPSSVQYSQPQRIAVHADEQFAIVLCSYIDTTTLKIMTFALFQLHLVHGIASSESSGHWAGQQIAPGSSNIFLTPYTRIRPDDTYPPEQNMKVPHIGLLMDPLGENMYFSINTFGINGTMIFSWQVNSMVAELNPIVLPSSINTIVKSNWYMSLSMSPDSKYLDMLNLLGTSVTHIPMKRPAGPWGAQKMCFVDGKCSCLAGFSGDLCNGDRCPDDPNKTLPGVCGCGHDDIGEDGLLIIDPSDCQL